MSAPSVEFWWAVFAGTAILLVLVIGIIASVIVSQRRFLRLQTEKYDQLIASKQKYDDLFNNVSDIIYIIAFDGTVLNVNEAVARLLGYSIGEVKGSSFLKYIDPKYHNLVSNRFLRGTSAGDASGVVAVLDQKGSTCYLEFRNSIIVQNDAPSAIRGIARDVSAQHKVKRALKESERHYRALFGRASVMRSNLEMLSREILRVQEEERKHISRDLHDEVGQLLTAMNMNLEMMRSGSARAGKKHDRLMQDIQNLADQIFGTIHRFSRELRPPMIDDLGLVPALRALVKSFSERTSIPVTFRGEAEVEALGQDGKLALYRIAQESLTNVAKHAHAKQVSIFVKMNGPSVAMVITDDGKAFTMKPNAIITTEGRGLGILGMQERMRLVHGEFDLRSENGKGTSIRVQVPLNGKKEQHGTHTG